MSQSFAISSSDTGSEIRQNLSNSVVCMLTRWSECLQGGLNGYNVVPMLTMWSNANNVERIRTMWYEFLQ